MPPPNEAQLLALARELPFGQVKRWTPRRKAAIAAAVILGRLGISDVERRYEVGEAELAVWLAIFKEHGVSGLRATHAQIFRSVIRRRRVPRSVNDR